MNESPSAGLQIENGQYQKCDNAAELPVDQRSDQAPVDSENYVAVNASSSRDRVTVWTSPASRSAPSIVRLANRAIAGQRVSEDDLPSD
jgi:hypothetical protein